MQDQIIREGPRSPEEAEQWLLWLLLRPSRCGPWHVQELARELSDSSRPRSRSQGFTPTGSRT